MNCISHLRTIVKLYLENIFLQRKNGSKTMHTREFEENLVRSWSQLDSWLFDSNICFFFVPIMKSTHRPTFTRSKATAHLVIGLQDANPRRNNMYSMLLWWKENLGLLCSIPTPPASFEIEPSSLPVFGECVLAMSSSNTSILFSIFILSLTSLRSQVRYLTGTVGVTI